MATYRRHASPRSGSWQYSAEMHPRAAGHGNISPWCVFGRRSVARFRFGAFSGARQWQNAREIRSPASGRGKILPWCVFGGPVVARLCRGAFPGGDPWRLFHFMRSRRCLGREKRQFAATYRRRASKTGWLRQDMRAVHPKSPANGRSGMHRANILPGRGPLRCAGPSNHARHADLAVVRRLNEKDRAKPKNCRHFDKNTFKSSH